jgi:hypothetical protein
MVTSPDSGSARRMSSSLRAATVVPVTSRRSRCRRCVVIWTSVSVDRKDTLLAVLADEDIGQNRHSVPTLDNTAHDLQWPEKGISGGFDQLHRLSSVVKI